MKRAVIFSNGEYRDLVGVRQRLHPDDLLICADGALGKLLALGLHPDLLVGDFDSLGEEQLLTAEQLGIRRVTFPAEKDFTDTELALREAVQAGCDQVLLVGAFGGRLDHALGNLFLLPPHVRQGLQLGFTDGVMDGYLITAPLQLRGCQGKIVSLLPITEMVEGVTLDGFYYPLQDYCLRWGQTIGISNLPLRDDPQISLRSGILLVIVTDEPGTA